MENKKELSPASINVEQEYEPYFGWCDVEGCENEACRGGGVWSETGYWKVCGKHSAEFMEGKPQPRMKQSSIDREKSRGADGLLPSRPNGKTQPQPSINVDEAAEKEKVKSFSEWAAERSWRGMPMAGDGYEALSQLSKSVIDSAIEKYLEWQSKQIK